MFSRNNTPPSPYEQMQAGKFLSAEQQRFVEMEARNAAQAILKRYGSKGDKFIQLIAREIVDELSRRSPAPPKPKAPAYGDDTEGSLF